MALSARDVLAAVIGVQKNMLKPEEVATAIAAGQPPGDHLGVKWDTLTDEAEDRLAVFTPPAPGAPAPPPRPRRASGRGPTIVAAISGVAAVALAVGMVATLVAWNTAVSARRDLEEKLEAAQKSEAEARDQAALA